MDIALYGLSAFSYVWNTERDNQCSKIKAFVRAVKVIPFGIKIKQVDGKLILQNHPTSLFARSISKRPDLLNLLNNNDDHQQQSTPSILRDHELNPLDTNTCELSPPAETFGQSTALPSDSKIPDTEEIEAGFRTNKDITMMEGKITHGELSTEQKTVIQPAIAISKLAQPINEDDFSFLDNFPCVEATQKQKTSGQSFLDDWFTNYHDTFVAHASPTVAEVYQSMLVEDQKLLPGEALCRKGFVNYETGEAHERKNLKFDMEKIKALILKEKIPLYDIMIEPRKGVKNSFQWSFVQNGMTLSYTDKVDYFDRINDVAKQNEIPAYLIHFVLDEMRDKECRVHSIIHTLYTDFQKQAQNNPEDIDSEDVEQTIANLISIKNIILGFDFKNTSELRFSPQSVYWGYGNLVILKGNLPKSIITRQGLLLNEVYGLQSMENNGSFYHLDLHEDDVLILAPRSVNGHSLEGLRGTIGYHNMYFYDELSDEYLDKLDVPEHLRAK